MRMTTLRPRRNEPFCDHLSVERLEARELFAGNVTAYMQGEMLVIGGDAEANGVELRYYSNAHTYRVIGQDFNGPTTVNGLDALQAPLGVGFSGVKEVYAGLGAGGDNLEVGSP